jgi:hypothetical protein
MLKMMYGFIFRVILIIQVYKVMSCYKARSYHILLVHIQELKSQCENIVRSFKYF